MNAKYTFAAAMAALILWCTPVAVQADRIPTKPLEPGDQHSIESDPWRPDAGDPRGLIVTNGPQTVSEPTDRSISQQQPAARPENWAKYVLRFLRVLMAGGVLR